jgi:hypothetical protein
MKDAKMASGSKYLTMFLFLAAFALGGSACGKDKSSRKGAWPSRPLVKTTAKIGPHKISILIPKGVGKYVDPNGIIWRHVSMDYTFFIKVFRENKPPNLAEITKKLAESKSIKVVSKRAISDGVLLVTEEPDKRHKVQVWKTKGSRTVKCDAFLGRKIDKKLIQQSNAWILKICRSIKIL